MRVCHVSPHLPPDQAANALLPALLGRWAAESGDEVTFVTHDPAQTDRPPEPLPGRAVVVPRRTTASPLLRRLRVDAIRRAQLIGAALDDAASRADLLHLHSNGLIVEVAARWAAARRRPFVLTLYGTEIWHYRRRWPIDPFTRAYHAAHAVTFYSQRLLDRARELGLARDRMQAIYPPVAEAFTPHDEAGRAALRSALGIPEPHVVLNVKRLHELAGQRYLLDAFAEATRGRADVRLVLCGTGPLRDALKAQAAALGIADRTTFAGLVDNDSVARYAAAADLFALPSLLEALPTVAVEALASGTPVLSADHPGGEELHGLFGDDVQIVPKADAGALAAALADRLRHPRRTTPATAAVVAARFRRPAIELAYQAIAARAVAHVGTP